MSPGKSHVTPLSRKLSSLPWSKLPEHRMSGSVWASMSDVGGGHDLSIENLESAFALGTREGGIPKQVLRQKSSQAWLTTTPARPATRKKECPFSTSEEVLGSSAPVVVVPLSEEPSFGGLSVKKQLTAWSLAHGARLVVTLASLYLSSIN